VQPLKGGSALHCPPPIAFSKQSVSAGVFLFINPIFLSEKLKSDFYIYINN